MTSVPDAVSAALRAEIRGRARWEELPGLYTMYVEGGRCHLRVLPVPDRLWFGGTPERVMLHLAGRLDMFAPALRRAAQGGLYGMAFRSETWHVRNPEDDPAAQAAAAAFPGPLAEHPDRIEARQIYAVDRAGVTYTNWTDRETGIEADIIILPGQAGNLAGDVLDALDRMVTATLGVTTPPRQQPARRTIRRWQ